jgi:hypothetical protein
VGILYKFDYLTDQKIREIILPKGICCLWRTFNASKEDFVCAAISGYIYLGIRHPYHSFGEGTISLVTIRPRYALARPQRPVGHLQTDGVVLWVCRAPPASIISACEEDFVRLER